LHDRRTRQRQVRPVPMHILERQDSQCGFRWSIFFLFRQSICSYNVFLFSDTSLSLRSRRSSMRVVSQPNSINFPVFPKVNRRNPGNPLTGPIIKGAQIADKMMKVAPLRLIMEKRKLSLLIPRYTPPTELLKNHPQTNQAKHLAPANHPRQFVKSNLYCRHVSRWRY